MIIKDISVYQISAPCIESPKFSLTPPQFRDILVLELETDTGIVGMGYLILLSGGGLTIQACIKELIIPELLGKNATDVEAIWQHLWKRNYWIGRMGVTVLAQSAVDIALWDALGKQTSMPLHLSLIHI